MRNVRLLGTALLGGVLLLLAGTGCKRSPGPTAAASEPAAPPAAPSADAAPSTAGAAATGVAPPPAAVGAAADGASPSHSGVAPGARDRLEAALRDVACAVKRQDRTGMAAIYERHGFRDASEWAQAWAAELQDVAWAERALAVVLSNPCEPRTAPAPR